MAIHPWSGVKGGTTALATGRGSGWSRLRFGELIWSGQKRGGVELIPRIGLLTTAPASSSCAAEFAPQVRFGGWHSGGSGGVVAEVMLRTSGEL